MISQELRKKWKAVRRIDFTGHLEPCRECGSVPDLYQIKPEGLYLLQIVQEDFFAVRCSCGMTGVFRSTGTNVLGDYIDATKAASSAANKWNREQTGI